MKIRNSLFTAAFLASVCSGAQAATLVGTTSSALGVNGLVADGITYDITFHQGSYNSVYGVGSPPQFTNTTTVDHITIALAAALNSFGVTQLAGFTAANSATYDLFTPWSNVAGEVTADAVFASLLDNPPVLFLNLASDNIHFNADLDFASLGFTDIQIEQSPVPATLPLFATGLGALGLLARRRKRKAKTG